MSTQAEMQYCPECGIKSTAGARVLRGEKGMSAATQNEMERLKVENADLTEHLKQAEWALAEGGVSLKSALEREQALAAHVERIISEWNKGDDQFSDEWINRMGDIVEDAPETTLTKRDLIKQAEALEYVSEKIDKASSVMLDLRAEYLRQQAEAQDD